MMFDLNLHETTALHDFSQFEPKGSSIAAPPLVDYWSRTFENPHAPSLLFEQEKLLRELQELANLSDNWDGEGAAQISERVITRTRSIIASIIIDNPSPELTPNPNGTISLEWESEGRFLHLEIGEKDFSILLGHERHPSRGAQGVGLPNKDLLESLIASVTSLGGNQDTSITLENLAA